jgi:hypothetical protein
LFVFFFIAARAIFQLSGGNKLEIRQIGNPTQKKSGNCERADKNQTESYEIEPNQSKDRATCMHEGNNDSFFR